MRFPVSSLIVGLIALLVRIGWVVSVVVVRVIRVIEGSRVIMIVRVV